MSKNEIKIFWNRLTQYDKIILRDRNDMSVVSYSYLV